MVIYSWFFTGSDPICFEPFEFCKCLIPNSIYTYMHYIWWDELLNERVQRKFYSLMKTMGT